MQMSRALVVYGTKTGCTAGVAEAIAQGLRESGVDADVVRAEEKPDPQRYEAVIVGSGVRAGLWHAHVKQWLVGHAPALKERPLAMFTVCLTMHSDPDRADTVRGYTDLLLTETGLVPVDIGLFPGMNLPSTQPLPERLIMRAMKAPEGDFRDMEAAADWGRTVAPALGLLS